MKNPTTRDLFAYWNERRGNRAAPERGDIEPNDIRHMLGDSFFLAADAAASYPFRLAGTRLCALFGRELKADSFLNLWGKAEQLTMRKLVSAVVDEKVGVVANATGRTADGAPLVLKLELLLLPLLHRNSMDARVLGALVPMTVPYWFGARVLAPLELGMLRHVGPGVEQGPVTHLVAAPKTVPVANTNLKTSRLTSSRLSTSGEMRHGFVVYQGGRAD
jgi:hypothetical protein